VSRWLFGSAVLPLAVVVAILANQTGTLLSHDDLAKESSIAILRANAEVADVNGWVNSIDLEKGSVTLDVGTSAVMGWPVPLKIGFIFSSGAEVLASLERNQRVVVSYRKRGPDLELVAIRVQGPSNGGFTGSHLEGFVSSRGQETSAD
jgi:hypothetical protein